MPVYQYACTECGEQLEVRQSFTDDALTVCPACEGRLRKVLSAVGVVFKGSGFYRTDSRNGSSSASAGTSNGSSDTKDGSGSTSEKSTKDATASGSGSSDSTGSGGSSSASTAAAAAS